MGSGANADSWRHGPWGTILDHNKLRDVPRGTASSSVTGSSSWGGLSAATSIAGGGKVRLPSVRECRIDARRRPQRRFRFDVSGRGPEQVPEIERWRRIRWIALHQNVVEALSFSNVSGFLISQIAAQCNS